MPLPNLSRLRLFQTNARGAMGGMFEQLYTLKFSEVVNGEMDTGLRKAFPFPLQWRDDDETFVQDSTPSGGRLKLTLNEATQTVIMSKNGTRIGEFDIVWGFVATVLNAVNRHYVDHTPVWRSIFGSAETSACDASRELLRLFWVHNASNDDAARDARAYQGASYGCINTLQRLKNAGSDWECLGKSKAEWKTSVDNIKSLMVVLPFDIHVARVVSTGHVPVGGACERIETFLSTTLNLRGVESGYFDKFADGSSENIVYMTITAHAGTRVLPVYALVGDNHNNWEYEVLIDSDQPIHVAGTSQMMFESESGRVDRRVLHVRVGHPRKPCQPEATFS